MLPDSERPKGLCKSAVAQSVYILVGKLRNADSALPTMDKEVGYELKLSLTKLYPSGECGSLIDRAQACVGEANS